MMMEVVPGEVGQDRDKDRENKPTYTENRNK
jgi:hypothetical protein